MDGLGVITTLSPTILPLLSERYFMTEQERPEDQLSPEPSTEEKKPKKGPKKATKKTRKNPIRQGAKKPKGDEPVIGATVSLNFAKRGLFGIGSLMLTHDTPTAVVPDTLTKAEEQVVKNALLSEVLVYGAAPKPGVDRNVDVLTKYIDAIKGARVVNRDLHPVVNDLARKKQVGPFTVHEVLEYMLQYEAEHENRQAFVEYLNYAMSRIPGPTGVTWTPPSTSTNDVSAPMAAPSEGYTSQAKGML